MKEEHKTTPEILIEEEEKYLRECRMSIQKLRDIIRKNPTYIYPEILLKMEEDSLVITEKYYKEMKGFYAREGYLP